MDQLVLAIFLIGFIWLGEKTGSPVFNVISAFFSVYLAFTIGIVILMIAFIGLAIFQLVYVFQKFR